MKREVTIEGAVEHVVYSNEETGWSVVRLISRGRGQVTAVGHLLGVQPGESLRLTGVFQHDPKWGEQLRVEGWMTVKPATFIGIEKYLSSGLVEGIGTKMARQLVAHFGLETLDVIDRNPERLTEVDGIGRKRSQAIRDAWQEQRGLREVMVFLQGHGVSTIYASKIWQRFGRETIARVREDPYCLAREIRGIGFRSADRIAGDLGLPRDAPPRLAAGVLHAVEQNCGEGNLYVRRAELLRRAADLLDVDPPELESALASLIEEGELIVAKQALGPDSQLDPPIAPRDLFHAEQSVARSLAALTAQTELPLKIDVERAVEWFEGKEDLKLGEGQKQALETALTGKVTVLTGGPGTGKTTLVRAVVEILRRKQMRVSLAAPTGRAAKRLAEATGHVAKTIHRLLEWSPQERAFQRGPDLPLELDLLVVDESSMLDVRLADALLRALDPSARLLLVGDVDQLPSVGPGQVLGDLVDSGVIPVARLGEIFRQAQESLIVVSAHRVREGWIPQLEPADGGDFFFISREDPAAALSTIKHLVAERIPRSFGIEADGIQILTPMQRGLLGVANVNAEMQALLNPPSEGSETEEWSGGARLLRVGDRVMQRRNNYDLEVWNGDLGRLVALDPKNKTARVRMDGDGPEGRDVEYSFAQLDELVLAYACSIHKSQGSEYPCVVIPLHTQHFVMLQRNLVYTAITRGKRLVVIVGSEKALSMAVRNASSSRRSTLLAERLRALHGEQA